MRSPWKLLFALMIIAGLAFYGIEMRAILRARKRRVLDWGLKYFLTAISLLGLLSLLALVLSWPGLPLTPFTGQLENLYGRRRVIECLSAGSDFAAHAVPEQEAARLAELERLERKINDECANPQRR